MKILFAGTPAFAAHYLEALTDSNHQIVAVITQPDRPGKRGKKPLPSPVKTAALQSGLQVLQPRRVTRTEIEVYKADLLVVVAFGQILGKDVLNAPRYGCINVHTSLLPRWRGAAPVQRAILAGDKETGISIMQMDEGLDTGPVLAMESIPLAISDSAGDIFNRLTPVGTRLLLQVVDGLSEDSLNASPQAGTGVTYAAKISKDEAKINWHHTARSILHTIKAFNPDPIAYCFLDKLRIRIWDAELSSANTGDEPPGTISELDSKGVHIATGDGCITLTRLQIPLGKGSVLTPHDILNSRREMLSPGTRLG